MLALGVPTGPITAVMLAAIMVHGIAPGPMLITEQPQLFWGFVASMYVGNVVLLVLNLPLVGIWVKLLTVPYRLLFPAIMAFSAIGIYSVNNSAFEIYLTALFGVLGFVLAKLGFNMTPLLLGFVLGPMMEENLRRSMGLSRGDPMIFVNRPISAFLLGCAALLLALAAARFVTSDLMGRKSGGYGVLGAIAAFLAAYLVGRVITMRYYTAPRSVHLDMVQGEKPKTE